MDQWTRFTRQATQTVAAGLLLALLPGCAGGNGTVAPDPKTSEKGEEFFRQAREEYLRLHTNAPPVDHPADCYDQVVRKLKGATDWDPDCPLFWSKLGAVRLEIGATDAAHEAHRRTVKLNKDWVPAWIGLAAWATVQTEQDSKKQAEAEGYLNDAQQALETLRKHTERLPVGPRPGGLAGLFAPKPLDPDEVDALTRTLNHLYLNEKWILGEEIRPGGEAKATGSPDAATTAGPGAGTTAGPGAQATGPGMHDRLWQRLRARVELQRALLAIQLGEPADYVIQLLDAAIEHDRDFAPPRFEKARQLIQTSRPDNKYQEAESLLLAYENHPFYRRDQLYLYAVARLYTDWYVSQSGPERAFDRAEEFYARLFDVNELLSDAWLDRATLLLEGGRRNGRRDLLDHADECVDNVEKILKTVTPRMCQIREGIQKARDALRRGEKA